MCTDDTLDMFAAFFVSVCECVENTADYFAVLAQKLH